MKLSPATDSQKALIARLEAEAGTSIKLCYQCGKCTAGCPAAFAMDYPPRQVIRLLQLGLTEAALNTDSVWICASCETCSSRCPRGVNIAALMDAVRREALAENRITDKKVAAFNQAFLNGVRSFGRTYEAGILLQYNTVTGQYLKDAELGLPMLQKGKVHLLPKMIKGRAAVKRIFARAQEKGGE